MKVLLNFSLLILLLVNSLNLNAQKKGAKKVESFVGEAGSVRMLGLLSLSAVSLKPGNAKGPELSEDATLREAMDAFISGAEAINVGTKGHLTFHDLQLEIAQTRAAAK